MKREKNIITALVVSAAAIIPSELESSRFFYYLVNFIIFFICVGLYYFLTRSGEGKNQGNTREIVPKSNLFKDQEAVEVSDFSEGIDIGSIVQYFLNMYRTQLNVSPAMPSRYFRSTGESRKGFYIYELRVLKNTDEWYTRRVTVGPIGVESGSRSNCFFATYDENIVIKVPPYPITDFRKYCNRIEVDRRIALKLAPIKSITPSIGWVMNKAMPQSDNEFLNAEQIETRYFHMLKTRTSIHEFLKIDNCFVYFMELSENYFMDQALRMVHDTGSYVSEEIKGFSHIVLDPQAFQGRYGIVSSEIPEKMCQMYDDFEAKISLYLKERGGHETISAHVLKAAFYAKLSGIEKFKDEQGLAAETYDQISLILASIFEESKKCIEDYYSAVSEFVSDVRKKNLKPVFASMITNSLDLLMRLRDKKIAIRDIKPDNLFLDGKKDDFPRFLKNHERFEVGLIDLETSVDYGRDDIIQPMLAGTPNYASPSHLFVNMINESLFGKPGDVFFMQDWHAVTAMIYRIITFEHLFSETSKFIFEIQAGFARRKEEVHDHEEYKKANAIYWKSAVKEFGSKLSKNSDYFMSISVAITEASARPFADICMGAVNDSSDYIAELIEQQPYFSDKSKKNSIFSSDFHGLEKELLNNSFQFLKEDRKWLYFNNASEFIRFIILLKRRREWYLKISENFMRFDGTGLSAFDIIVFMFSETLRFFEKETWKKSFLSSKHFRL